MTIKQTTHCTFTVADDPRNGKNYGGQKEMTEYLEAVTSRGENPVTVRWYMGRSQSASVVYCTIWIHGQGFYRSGSGKAGGHGYCKVSAAFAEALESAGLKVTDEDGKLANIHGVGGAAVRAAVEAIGRMVSGGQPVALIGTV